MLRTSLSMDAQLRHSLRWRLAALICGLCGVMLLVVLYAAYREVESTLEQAASDRARAAADQIATIFGTSGLQSFGQLQRVAPSASSYLRQPTDAHLAALAVEHGATVYTTDRDFLRFPNVRVVNPIAGRE